MIVVGLALIAFALLVKLTALGVVGAALVVGIVACVIGLLRGERL